MTLHDVETKDYLRRQYSMFKLDYDIARDAKAREIALDNMAKIYNLASQIQGFDFADSLQKAEEELKR